jgi:MFS family permease
MGSVLLPALLVVVLEATPAGLGVIEGVAIGLAAVARVAGATLLHHPQRRRKANVAGYGLLAVCTSLMGAAAATGQAAVLRSGAWIAGGFRTAATPLDIYEEAHGLRLGRAFGADRAVEYVGAGAGAAAAVVLVAVLDVRAAIAFAAIPGLVAVVAAWRSRRKDHWAPPPDVPSLRVATRELGRGRLGWTLAGIGALEAANITFTLLILRATTLFEESRSVDSAVIIAILLFCGYRLAGALAGAIGGRRIDRDGPLRWLASASLTLLVAYAIFARTGGEVIAVAIAFALAGAAVGIVETAEGVAVADAAPEHARSLAFGAVTALQSAGRLVASVGAGVIWTVFNPEAGLLVTAPLLLACPLILLTAARRR